MAEQDTMYGVTDQGLRLHLYTDDGRLDTWVFGAHAVPRAGETLAIRGVVHEVEGVHWSWQSQELMFGVQSEFNYQQAHLRLRPIAQEGTPGEALR